LLFLAAKCRRFKGLRQTGQKGAFCSILLYFPLCRRGKGT